MMYMSFTGIMKNASEGVALVESDIGLMDRDFNRAEEDELLNGIGNIKTCISAYHDTILGILKGDITVEQVKDFWFHFDPEKIATTPYRGDILRIGPDEEAS